jgi:hypothetical protein
MKKIVLTASFVLASIGAFATNTDIKSNNTIVPVKNKVKFINISNKNISFDLKFQNSCDANIDNGLFTIIVVWCC